MKAYLKAVRIAPKKASLVARMVRGMSVPDAMYALERTNKKAARLLEDLLRSAIANASHNDKQDPQMMVIKEIVVNKAQAYNRGVPMARGRIRPMRKFLSHIELSLGFAGDAPEKKASPSKVKKAPTASQTAKKPVEKKPSTSSKGTKGKSAKDTTASDSPSSLSAKDSPSA